MIVEIPDDNSIIKDLISREDLIRTIKTECNPYGAPTIDYESGLRVLEIIDRAPTVVPERPQGEWIKLRDYDFKCSLCGYSLMDKYNYCPECGADMRGKADHLRDCENCIHHSENGCEVWECEFKRRSK